MRQAFQIYANTNAGSSTSGTGQSEAASMSLTSFGTGATSTTSNTGARMLSLNTGPFVGAEVAVLIFVIAVPVLSVILVLIFLLKPEITKKFIFIIQGDNEYNLEYSKNTGNQELKDTGGDSTVNKEQNCEVQTTSMDTGTHDSTGESTQQEEKRDGFQNNTEEDERKVMSPDDDSPSSTVQAAEIKKEGEPLPDGSRDSSLPPPKPPRKNTKSKTSEALTVDASPSSPENLKELDVDHSHRSDFQKQESTPTQASLTSHSSDSDALSGSSNELTENKNEKKEEGQVGQYEEGDGGDFKPNNGAYPPHSHEYDKLTFDDHKKESNGPSDTAYSRLDSTKMESHDALSAEIISGSAPPVHEVENEPPSKSDQYSQDTAIEVEGEPLKDGSSDANLPATNHPLQNMENKPPEALTPDSSSSSTEEQEEFKADRSNKDLLQKHDSTRTPHSSNIDDKTCSSIQVGELSEKNIPSDDVSGENNGECQAPEEEHQQASDL